MAKSMQIKAEAFLRVFPFVEGYIDRSQLSRYKFSVARIWCYHLDMQPYTGNFYSYCRRRVYWDLDGSYDGRIFLLDARKELLTEVRPHDAAKEQFSILRPSTWFASEKIIDGETVFEAIERTGSYRISFLLYVCNENRDIKEVELLVVPGSFPDWLARLRTIEEMEIRKEWIYVNGLLNQELEGVIKYEKGRSDDRQGT